jgi:hypothetical protein
MINSTQLDDARQLLTPSIPRLLRSLDEAITEWNAAPAVYHAAMDASARATILNKLTYHYAASNLDGVVFGEDQLQRYMRFGELTVVRVKLLDSQLRSRNYPTRRAREWIRRVPLPGWPVSRLHFGYRLDVTGSVLEDVFVTLPNGDRMVPNDWVWQVRGPAIEPFPVRQNLFGEEVYRYDDFSRAV